jgi:hypothetical protein
MTNPFRRRPKKITVHSLFEFEGRTMRVTQMSYDFTSLRLDLVDEQTYQERHRR